MAKRLRVGYLSGSAVVGGTERYLRELARSVDQHRFEPVILRRPVLAGFFSEDGGPVIAQADDSAWEPGSRVPVDRWATGAGPLSMNAPALSQLRAAFVPVVKQLATEVDRRRLKKTLAHLEVDLLHVHNGGHLGSPTALGAVLAAADLQIPTVLTVHNIAKRRGFLRRREAVLDRRLAASAMVTTVGDAPARALAELRGFDPASVRVVVTGIRPDTAPASGRAARARLGLGAGLPTVGSIAALTPVKGHLALLDALVQVRQKVPGLRVVLAGEGPIRSQVAERAEALGLAEIVDLPGSVDPFATLTAFDVFVSASTTEGLPLTILEAMSQGIPVVATKVGAVAEAVIHGETGFLVTSGDIHGMARRLVEVLADPVLARRLGEAGRQRFEARHRIEDMVSTFERLYHEVLDQPQ